MPETAGQGVIGADRVDLLRRIGQLLRGDWSMHRYDGRDVNGWIESALDGDAGQLDDELRKLEDD